MPLQNRRVLLGQLWPLLVVPAAFAAFVVVNGGIVVGDRANHTPKLHLAQPLYCLLFCAGFLPQIMFHPARCSYVANFCMASLSKVAHLLKSSWKGRQLMHKHVDTETPIL